MFLCFIASFLLSTILLIVFFLFKMDGFNMFLETIRSYMFFYFKIELGDLSDMFISIDCLRAYSTNLISVYVIDNHNVLFMTQINDYINLIADFASSKMNKFTLTIFELFRPYLT